VRRPGFTKHKSYGHATSLEDAKAAFRAEYETWKGTKKHVSRLSNSSHKQGDTTMRNLTVATAFAFAIAAMFVLAPANAQQVLKSGEKCWVNYGWGDCPREQAKSEQPKKAPKVSKVSAAPPSRPRPAAEGGGGGGGGRY
jgi:hypothetical protein